MRDQLSAREEDHYLGNSLGEADDVPSEKFFKGSFEKIAEKARKLVMAKIRAVT